MKISCPNDEIFADYIEGRLSEEKRFEVEDHLSSCDRCIEELVVASSVFQEEERFQSDSVPVGVTKAAVRLVQGLSETGPSLSERVKQSIGDISAKVSDYLAFKPGGGLQLEPIRGSKTRLDKDLIQVKKKYRDFDVEIEMEKMGENKAHIRVKIPGMVEEKGPVRVTLKRGDRDVASQLLSGDYVLFENIPFGHYSLIFSTDGVELGEYHFEIRENRHAER
jgi:hypothetical protein